MSIHVAISQSIVYCGYDLYEEKQLLLDSIYAEEIKSVEKKYRQQATKSKLISNGYQLPIV